MATSLTDVTIALGEPDRPPNQVDEPNAPTAPEESDVMRVERLRALYNDIRDVSSKTCWHRGRDRTQCSCDYCKDIREAFESALETRHAALVNAILTDSGFAELWAVEALKNQFSFETDWILEPLVSGNNYAATLVVFEERFAMAFESTHADKFRDFFKMCRDNSADKCIDALMVRYPRLVRRLVAHFDALEDQRKNAGEIAEKVAAITAKFPAEVRQSPGFCICVSCMWRYPQHLTDEDRDFIRTRANILHKRRF